MNIRHASPDDTDAVRSVAKRSLEASYSDFLDSETIRKAVETWYGNSLTEAIETGQTTILVAESDGDIAGFSQSEFLGEGHKTGQIHWIHVDPDNRRMGIASQLLTETREVLIDEGVDHIRAAVLAENEFGNEFYKNNGFQHAGTSTIRVGDMKMTENLYIESTGDVTDDWRGIEPVALETDTVFVSYGEPVRGSKSPFYSCYSDKEGENRYGWFCSECDSIDNAMDTMGRIECNSCGNRRKATRWDASYL